MAYSLRVAVRQFASLQKLSEGALSLLAQLTKVRADKKIPFSLALSGGSTPRLFYEYLAITKKTKDIPLKEIHYFWGDERCVEPAHAESNFSLALNAFLAKRGVPAQNIHRIPGEIKPPQKAARAYENDLRGFFHEAAFKNEFPAFDLIVLGLGADGHTASLFPGDSSLKERRRWVTTARAPGSAAVAQRITLTLPVINQARCVLFLVSGKEKKEIVERILGVPQQTEERLPAAQIKPQGQLFWFLA